MKAISQLLVLLITCLCTSCGSYHQSTKEFRKAWDMGDEVTALAKIQAAGSSIKEGHDEELLWNLEMLSMARANEEDALADFHLERASQLTEDQTSGLINPQNKGLGEYVGKYYDRNMLNVYKAIRALEQKDLNKVNSTLTAIKFQTVEATKLNEKRNDDAEAKVAEEESLNMQKFKESGMVKTSDLLNEELSSMYDPFYNPTGDYLRLVLDNRFNTDSASDKSKLIQKGAFSAKNPKFLQSEGKNATPATYVFMETGSAPYRLEKKYRLPLIIFFNGNPPGGVLYVPFAIPQLQYREDHDSSAIVSAGSTRLPLEQLVNMDAVVTAEFKAKLPAEIAKAMIQTTLAVLAQVAIEAATKEQAQDSAAIAIFSAIAKVAAAEAFTQADERGWYSLPKKILVQKVPTPKDGRLTVSTASGQSVSVQVDSENKTNFVYLKSIRRANTIKVLSNFGFADRIADLQIGKLPTNFLASKN